MAYGRFAQVYDRLMADMPYGEWLRFVEECWEKVGRPRTIADLGCGTGNLAIPLARTGLTVYGIDLSEDMLAKAQEKWLSGEQAGASGGQLLFLAQDMREWEVPEPVDAVLSFCDCLNYITEEEDVAAVFNQTYRNLRPGGVFVFDVLTRRRFEYYAAYEPFVWNEEDLAYIWTSKWDEERQEIEHELTFFVQEDDGRFVRFQEWHVQRAYPQERLVQLLAEAGFSQIETVGDFTWEAAHADTERAFFVARKREN